MPIATDVDGGGGVSYANAMGGSILLDIEDLLDAANQSYKPGATKINDQFGQNT
jgi:hypothetical protein